MTGDVRPSSSPVTVLGPAAPRECMRAGCSQQATAQYVHRCEQTTLFCEVHRREHERRTDPARNLPALCTRCRGVAPWPVPWTAVTR